MNYLNKYIDYLKYERKLSDNTILSYKNDLNDLYIFFNEEIINVKYEDLVKYINSLSYLNSRSLAHHVSVIKSFYAFLVLNEDLNINPAENLCSPKLAKQLPHFLTEEEINELLNINLVTPYDYRNKAMLEVLYATGLRISELINLKFSNIDLHNATIRVIGKGNKERIVLLNEIGEKYLKIYIDEYRNLILNNSYSDYLFISNAKKNITRQGFFKILKKECERAGIKKNVSPHVLRHSFATHMLSHGADIRVIQELLGHSNITTTEIYTHIIDKKIKNDYDNNHPRSHK